MLNFHRRDTSQGHIINMTKGSPFALILRFGLPLIAANILQQMYSLIDSIVLGLYDGMAGLAVLGASNWPIWLSVSIIINFSQAGCFVLAKRIGSGETEGFKVALGSIYTMAGILCILMMFCMQWLTRPLLILLDTPIEILDDAILYQRIIFAGILPLFVYNILSAFLRAIGDSRTPFYAILTATFVNVVLDILFVAALRYGVGGAALATILAQTMSAIVCSLRVLKYRQFRLSRSHLRYQFAVLKEFFSLSFPMLLQSFVLASGGFFVQAHINFYGAAFAAGMSATDKVTDS